ncbi:hypothetical protein HYE68_000142 [Fusarium pseudograminearum]|nr:hypothetical protein HYE68_000142 [Fusarium pseudograminearum]
MTLGKPISRLGQALHVSAEEEEETATADSSYTDIPSQPSLFTSSLSLTLSEISTTASQSAPLLPTSSLTDSTIAALSTDTSLYSEPSLLEPPSSTLLSTDSTAIEPFTEETTTSISTTTLAEESETSSLPTSSAQLETTTTAETTTGIEAKTAGDETTTTDTTTVEDETTATETTTIAEEALATETTTTATETTTAAEDTTITAEGALATETTTTAEETTATETTTTAEEETTAAETTATDTTAIAEDTTTTAEETIPTTATTTTGCDSVMVLSTVALLNPTPVFDDSDNHDDSIADVVLPFNVANSGQSTVYVSVNGLIAVGSDAVINSYENVELPTTRLPPIAVCPYWDDLSLIRENGDSIVYEVFNGQHGMQATFEWIVTSSNAATSLHFTATFYKDFPQVTRFSYYSTDGGTGATTGAQNRDTGDFRQISFNEPDSVVDGTAVFFNFDTGYGDTVSFDNTECGKGDPSDRSSAFNNGG